MFPNQSKTKHWPHPHEILQGCRGVSQAQTTFRSMCCITSRACSFPKIEDYQNVSRPFRRSTLWGNLTAFFFSLINNLQNWRVRRGMISQPSAWQADALSIWATNPKKMVAVVGVEPIKILRINRIKLDLWKPAGGFTPPSLSVVNTAINGEPEWNRTTDTLGFSEMLY